MTIGFSNGVFHRLFQNPIDRFDFKYIDIFKNAGANAIELMCLDENRLDYLLENSYVDPSDFSYISMHAPNLSDNPDIAHEILLKLEKLKHKLDISNFVFHADRVIDWNIFNDHNLPISIENMDERKNFGRTLDDIGSILTDHDFGLTLDLQHCYVNDRSMKLAVDFQEQFGDRIVEYHISGYEKSYPHYSLFKAKQSEIIATIKYINVPIIIESGFDAISDAGIELEYIKSHLSKNQLH